MSRILSHRTICMMVFSLSMGIAFLVPLAGCSKKSSQVSAKTNDDGESSSESSSPKAGVATINVNQIATDCGALAEINRELDKKEAEFNLILDGLRKIHLDELAEKEKEFGDKPTEEQTRSLATLRSRQAAKYNAKWQDTRIKLSAIKTKLDEAFLTRLKPLAQKVAAEKGLSVVIRSENVFCLVDQFDITDEVSTAFQNKFPQKEIAPIVKVAEIPSRGGGFEPRK